MIKFKYKPILGKLQNLTNSEYSHSDVSADLFKYGIDVSANALSNRCSNDGYLNENEVIALEKEHKIDLRGDNTLEDCILIPVRGGLSASMGFGIEIIDESQTGTYPTPKKLARALGLKPEMADYILAEGDSMEPTIDGGSMVLVDHTRKEVIDGKIFCIRLNNKLMAKRLQFIPPKNVSIISDNPKYKSFDIDLSKDLDFDFDIIGEVRWWGTLAR